MKMTTEGWNGNGGMWGQTSNGKDVMDADVLLLFVIM